MKKIIELIKSLFTKISLLGLVLGAIGGYLYYYYIGCSSGSCAITSNPYMSIIWGALMGFLLFDMFRKNKKKSDDHSESSSD